MDLDTLIDMDKKYYMQTFGNRTPVCFVKGEGIHLWDTRGEKYEDFLAGIAVSALGHSHPALVQAITDQAKKLIHCSNYYYIESQARLAKLLAENSCCDRVFFCNSGAEANEGAIKLARIFYKKKGIENKYEIISLHKSFHGRTLATLAATGQEKYKAPYAPLTPTFINVPINDYDALFTAVGDKTCAILLEPIQGEGGVNLISSEYAQRVRKLCDEKDILLIFDEVQTGLGRTGKLFGYEHLGIEPDIFTLAKALGGGVPIGALCAKDFVASAFEPGDHGSTFGGNPLATSAGYAVLSTILNDKLPSRAATVGKYFMEGIKSLKDKHPLIGEVRGKGLMIGLELTEPLAKKLHQKLLDKHYLTGAVSDRVLRMLPPLIVTEEEIDGFIKALDTSLSQLV